MPLPPEIGGVLIGPLIAAIIEALKAAGMPVKYARWANLVLAMLSWFVIEALGVWPEYQGWVGAVLRIVIIILTAAGFYEEAVKRVTRQRFNK
jgi:hypothetical protein